MLACATVTITATAIIGSAEAKPGFPGGFKPWPTFNGPKYKPWPTYNPHPHWHGGVGIGLIGVGIGSGLASAASDDCYTVRSRVFVPGVGIVIKRRLVCD
jgi:hypothetical protein